MISKHGKPLMTDEARKEFARLMLPRAAIVTPNLHEAAELANIPVQDMEGMKEAARKIASQGAQSVLVKGGHLKGDAVDVLYWRGEFLMYAAPRIQTLHTHGTGCTYSACITAELAKGKSIPEAVEIAKRFITLAIQTNPNLGKGCGPVNHHAEIK
jgi:hydroxymethylpyrimidine/phosphomethylpyrimidine kinase